MSVPRNAGQRGTSELSWQWCRPASNIPLCNLTPSFLSQLNAGEMPAVSKNHGWSSLTIMQSALCPRRHCHQSPQMRHKILIYGKTFPDDNQV